MPVGAREDSPQRPPRRRAEVTEPRPCTPAEPPPPPPRRVRAQPPAAGRGGRSFPPWAPFCSAENPQIKSGRERRAGELGRGEARPSWLRSWWRRRRPRSWWRQGWRWRRFAPARCEAERGPGKRRARGAGPPRRRREVSDRASAPPQRDGRTGQPGVPDPCGASIPPLGRGGGGRAEALRAILYEAPEPGLAARPGSSSPGLGLPPRPRPREPRLVLPLWEKGEGGGAGTARAGGGRSSWVCQTPAAAALGVGVGPPWLLLRRV